ncbi:hypothetical protein [Paenibacillus illinoisensis]|uniref:hypothetical protein n=1 Tax=Paenibacillus illinoisensis TaxID=59845 RepID=UPI00301DCA86
MTSKHFAKKSVLNRDMDRKIGAWITVCPVFIMRADLGEGMTAPANQPCNIEEA